MAHARRRRVASKHYCVKKGRKVVRCYASLAAARRHANRIGARCSTVRPKRARSRRRR